ncbi:MAG: hypothetical protein WA192_16235 [Candidatus Acidiferrales bacterium]
MKMIGKMSRIQILLLSLLSSMAFPSFAGAQPVDGGRFTLASAARWGSIVLPAGDYTYGVDQNSTTPLVTIYTTNGTGKGFVFPASVSEISASEPARLVLEEKNGETVVTALYVKELGLVLYYKAAPSDADAAHTKLAMAQKMGSYPQGK